MKKRLLVFLAVLLVLAACTPGALAYDVAAEQAEDFGTASLEYALPEQAYDAFGALSVADAAQPQSLLAKLWAYVLHEGGGAVASAARNAALLLAVVFLTALASLFPTSESLRRITKLAGGIALTCLLFSPLVTFDYDAYAAALQDYHVSVSTDGAVSDSSERLQRTVIESEMRTYILDKAVQCGAALDDAQVTLRWSTEGYWYPQSVRLITSGPAAENSRLAQIIEADLGIPRARQEWSSTS